MASVVSLDLSYPEKSPSWTLFFQNFLENFECYHLALKISEGPYMALVSESGVFVE